MKKVVLFSRNDLVNLYGGLNQYLTGSVDVIHLAYSQAEEQILKENYHIAHVINFQEEINRLVKSERLDLMLINQIDQLIIDQTDNRFCLNSCIQSDRTFSGLDYEEILILVQVYYKFWDTMMVEKKFDFLLHEAVALFFLQIASVVCKKHGAEYLTQIQVFGEGKYNWIFVSADNGFTVEMPGLLSGVKYLNHDDKKRVADFLGHFRKDFRLIIPQLSSNIKNPGDTSFLKFALKLLRTTIKYIYHKITTRQIVYNPEDHLIKYLARGQSKLSDLLKNQYDDHFYLRYDEFDPDKKFYYYPMHMEPEAVVLYWGDGIYKNQVKLIENIAGQLPPNCYLYVKVHPIVKEKRNYLDYLRIKAIPNIRLLGLDVPGKLIISKCLGLMTINGTSGFEAILMNKHVYVFGNSFYDLSDRVFKIQNIRNLREVLYQNLNKTFTDDQTLYQFLSVFLKISHRGFVAYYSNYRELLNIDPNKNLEEVAMGMIGYFTSGIPSKNQVI